MRQIEETVLSRMRLWLTCVITMSLLAVAGCGDTKSPSSSDGGTSGCNSCAGGGSGCSQCTPACTGGQICCAWAGGVCIPNDAGGCSGSGGFKCAMPTSSGVCPNQCYP